MFSFREAVFALVGLACVGAAGVASAQGPAPYPGVGRNATAQEVAAWDIDVRPDFKGLPAGAGSVARGQEIWEGKCAQCHGVFGESNQVFNPLIGGTTAADIRTGQVSELLSPTGGRSTLMKLATVSTLWDYINRAMPWTAPKSLTPDEVYAVTAFMLNLAGVLPDGFTLTDKNIADAQARMPNRNGMTTRHALWPGREFAGAATPDTRNVACMTHCGPEPRVVSMLPDFARNAHGNLSEQNRAVGPQRGVDTSQPERRVGMAAVAPAQAAPVARPAAKADSKASPAGVDNQAALALLGKHSCTACHGINHKIVGPGFNEVAQKHPGKVDYLAAKIKAGGSGVWGSIPMPPQTLSESEAKTLAVWLASGAGR